jgi:hypothetical protein
LTVELELLEDTPQQLKLGWLQNASLRGLSSNGHLFSSTPVNEHTTAARKLNSRIEGAPPGGT